MITAKIYRDGNDDLGILVQLMTVPRKGEMITILDSEKKEHSYRASDVMHYLNATRNHLGEPQTHQSEVVIFAVPACLHERDKDD